MADERSEERQAALDDAIDRVVHDMTREHAAAASDARDASFVHAAAVTHVMARVRGAANRDADTSAARAGAMGTGVTGAGAAGPVFPRAVWAMAAAVVLTFIAAYWAMRHEPRAPQPARDVPAQARVVPKPETTHTPPQPVSPAGHTTDSRHKDGTQRAQDAEMARARRVAPPRYEVTPRDAAPQRYIAPPHYAAPPRYAPDPRGSDSAALLLTAASLVDTAPERWQASAFGFTTVGDVAIVEIAPKLLETPALPEVAPLKTQAVAIERIPVPAIEIFPIDSGF